MTHEREAMLIAEIGSVTTRVTLIDEVEGEYRFIGQAEKPSTIEPPFRNATIAILEAAAEIAEATGRKLLQEGQLLMPQNNERDGVSTVIATTSAAGHLSLAIVAIASDISAQSALHACRSTYTTVLQIVSLDDPIRPQERHPLAIPAMVGQHHRPTKSRSAMWVERQVEALLALNPNTIVLAGGLEGGATSDTLRRLAHIVALATIRPAGTSPSQDHYPMRANARRTVIFAGNSVARTEIQTILGERANLIMVDNVRPTLERERLEPTRQAIERLYQEQMLPHLPGYAVLERLCSAPLTTVAQNSGLITRFLAVRQQRQILTLDVGATSTSALLASPDGYYPVVHGICGSGYGITTVLAERGIANIARWLPFHRDERDLLHWMLNKLLRPHVIPSRREDILIEHAVAREALRLVLDTLAKESPLDQYDLVIATGGVLGHAPHPGLAALTVLDALQPTAERSERAIDLHLDRLGLLPVCGALAAVQADAAVTLLDRDFYQNAPLGTCIVPLGEERIGKPVLEAELITTNGKTIHTRVLCGQIARLPLEPGERGQLILRPAAGVRIGRNAPGAEVKSDIAAVAGSALGVIIDARGRPLRLEEDAQKRSEQLWSWLVALGVEQGANPYLDQVPAGKTISSVTFDEFLPGESSLSLADILGESEPSEVVTPPLSPGKKQEPAPDQKRTRPPSRSKKQQRAAPEPQAAAATTDKPGPDKPTTEGPPRGGGPDGEAKPIPQGSGKRISLSDLMQEEAMQPGTADSPTRLTKLAKPPTSASPGTSGSTESDLANLRQVLTKLEKPKRGLFGRKK